MASIDDHAVLVTGASGFVAMHCILRLLNNGYRVRGTVRDASRSERVMEALARQTDVSRLSLVEADLSSDPGWEQAVADCALVLHVASPVPREPPKTADEVIAPARDGALRVLKAAATAGVKRVVMTSSISAVLYGHTRDGSKIYDENDWSKLSDDVSPYDRSKTIAERAAWDYVKGLPDRQRLELVTINPGVVLGPILDNEFSISGEVVRKLLAAELPGIPDLGWAAVDVRDLADVHIAAMTHPEAAGQRFVVAIEHASWQQIAQILARHFGTRGFKVPTRRVPNFVLKIVSLWDKTARMAVPELGKRQDLSCERARKVLGWKPRDLETMVVDMAESMIQLGVVSDRRRPATVRQVSEAR
jgi:dihydroflavonol-4-reductase